MVSSNFPAIPISLNYFPLLRQRKISPSVTVEVYFSVADHGVTLVELVDIDTKVPLPPQSELSVSQMELWRRGITITSVAIRVDTHLRGELQS